MSQQLQPKNVGKPGGAKLAHFNSKTKFFSHSHDVNQKKFGDNCMAKRVTPERASHTIDSWVSKPSLTSKPVRPPVYPPVKLENFGPSYFKSVPGFIDLVDKNPSPPVPQVTATHTTRGVFSLPQNSPASSSTPSKRGRSSTVSSASVSRDPSATPSKRTRVSDQEAYRQALNSPSGMRFEAMASQSQKNAKKGTNKRYSAAEKSKATCFVISFPDLSEEDQEKKLRKYSLRLSKVDTIRLLDYMVWGHEVGEHDGIKHLQCYAYFKQAQVFSHLKATHSAFKHARFLVALGSPLSNKVYCSKGPDCKSDDARRLGTQAMDYGKNAEVYEIGEFPMGNERATLEYVAHLIRMGDKPSRLYADPRFKDVVVKYGTHLSKMHAAIAPPRSSSKPSKCFFFSGPTGSGKSRTANEFCKAYAGEDEVCTTGPSEDGGKLTWCGNYESGQKCLVLNDLRGDSVPFNYFLTLIDPHYAHCVNVKYGLPTFSPDYIIITSPLPMEEFFKGTKAEFKEDLKQFYRRVHGQFKFGDGPGEWDFESAVRHMCEAEGVDVSKVDFTDYTPDNSAYTTDGLRPNANNTRQKLDKVTNKKTITIDMSQVEDDFQLRDPFAVQLDETTASPSLREAVEQEQADRFLEFINDRLKDLDITDAELAAL